MTDMEVRKDDDHWKHRGEKYERLIAETKELPVIGTRGRPPLRPLLLDGRA